MNEKTKNEDKYFRGEGSAVVFAASDLCDGVERRDAAGATARRVGRHGVIQGRSVIVRGLRILVAVV